MRSPSANASRPRGLRIVSGGQTGVDRAALDVALRLRLPCGGFCPKGRLAEDGPLPERYPLVETPSADYAQRTEWNVRDADGTVVLATGSLQGGTAYTARHARALGKPLLVVRLDEESDPQAVAAWVAAHAIRVLNVAGPRESQRPGIYARASSFLEAAFTSIPGTGSSGAGPRAPGGGGSRRA